MSTSYEPGFFLDASTITGLRFANNDNFGFHIRVRDDGKKLQYPISVDWEVFFERDDLTGLPYIGANDAFTKGHLANSLDFAGPYRGTSTFTEGDSLNTIILAKNPSQKMEGVNQIGSWNPEEIYGVRLSNPLGAEIQQGNGTSFAKIKADDLQDFYVKLELANGKRGIEEGEEIELKVRSNAIEEYFSETKVPALFMIQLNNTNSDTYADGQDFSTTISENLRYDKYFNLDKYIFDEIDIPILNGSTFKLPAFVIPRQDDAKEKDETFWISYTFVNDYAYPNPQSPYMTSKLETVIIDEAITKQTTKDTTGGVAIRSREKYSKKSADRITNYSDSPNQRIQINLSTFIEGTKGKIKIVKSKKKVEKFSRKNIDFIYSKRSGLLYYNENGDEAGFGNGGILAILEGRPKISQGNFEFI